MAFAIFALAVIVVGVRLLDGPSAEFDLVPFYCGGAAVASGADPYVSEPLRSCEHAASAAYDVLPGFVLPDPLPAYDQTIFALVSRAGFAFVRATWPALELAAFVCTVPLLARVARASGATIAAVLVVPDLWCAGILGQLEPFAILGLVLAAWGLARKRTWATGAGLALAAIEPQIGLPAFAAVALFGDRAARTALALATVALAALSLRLPLATLVAYVTQVLPAHALSEVNDQNQYGTVYLLHRAGFSEGGAVHAASVLYVVILAASLIAARAAARRFGAEALPLAASAIALVGAPFGHLPQIAAALPAALFVASRGSSRLAGAAVALLSVPWLDFTNALRVLPLTGTGLYVALRVFCRQSFARSAVAIAVASLALIAMAYEATLHATGDVVHLGRALASDLPETAWKSIVDAQEHRYRALADIAKIPTQAGLLALAVAIVRASSRAVTSGTAAYDEQLTSMPDAQSGGASA